MAPTMEVEPASLSSSTGSMPGKRLDQGSTCGFADPMASVGKLRSSEGCPACKTALHTCKSAIPEASPVFKEALDKLKLEKAQAKLKLEKALDNCKKDISEKDDKTPSSPPAAANPPSFLTKLKSAFKPTATVSPQPTPNRCQGLPSKSSAAMKPVRRPASFGGSDGIKLSAGRRASQFEKRVSWADEYGSNHPLFSVRLIRPRLSADNNHVGQSSPGHSILRNTGIC
ncbi:hypothetical protein BsWGS_20061 [Bradybaena similaris]